MTNTSNTISLLSAVSSAHKGTIAEIQQQLARTIKSIETIRQITGLLPAAVEEGWVRESDNKQQLKVYTLTRSGNRKLDEHKTASRFDPESEEG